MWKHRINPNIREEDRETMGMVLGICPYCRTAVLKSEQHDYELPRVVHNECQVKFAGLVIN